MKIVVLNTPFLPMYSRASRSPAVTKSSTLYYPIYLAYATGVLEQDRHEVKLIDCPAMDWDKEEVYKFIPEFKPDMVVVDTTTTPFLGGSLIVPLLFLVFIISSLPFVIVAFRRDAILGLLSPFLLFMRACTFLLGNLSGLINEVFMIKVKAWSKKIGLIRTD